MSLISSISDDLLLISDTLLLISDNMLRISDTSFFPSIVGEPEQRATKAPKVRGRRPETPPSKATGGNRAGTRSAARDLPPASRLLQPTESSAQRQMPTVTQATAVKVKRTTAGETV